MTHPRVDLAYLFWGLSLVGVAGLHRIYLRRHLSGILYLATFGLLGVGTVLDGMHMRRLVRRARLEAQLEALMEREELQLERPASVVATTPMTSSLRDRLSRVVNSRQHIQRIIISLAREGHGVITVTALAEAAQTTMERAQSHLDRLVVRGLAGATPTIEGALIYHLPDLLDDTGRRRLEGF